MRCRVASQSLIFLTTSTRAGCWPTLTSASTPGWWLLTPPFDASYVGPRRIAERLTMRRVFITGIGAVTPYGTGAEALKDGLLSGRSAVRTISSFDASRLPVRIGGELPPLHVPPVFDAKELPWVARLSLYTVAAAREALAGAAIETVADPDRGGVYVGTGFGSVAETAEHFYLYREIGDRAARITTIPRMMPNGPPGQVA